MSYDIKDGNGSHRLPSISITVPPRLASYRLMLRSAELVSSVRQRFLRSA